MDKDFDFNKVPRSWLLCYVPECPRKEECLRYQVCLAAPPDRYFGTCVMPNVLLQDPCPMFRPIRKMTAAIGFRHIFNNVLAKDIVHMRAELAAFLGSVATFYRYRSGERPLNPRQQQWIKDMFRRHGYSDDVAFDEIKDIYFFD